MSPYLSYIPFGSELKKSRARKQSVLKEVKKTSLSPSDLPSSLAPVVNEQGVSKLSNAEAILTEPQILSKSEDQFGEETKRLREQGLDKAMVSRGGLLRYLEYASVEKEALKGEYHERARNLDSRLSRVKKRLIKVEVHRAGAEMGPQDIEMTGNPLQPSIGPEL